MADTPSSIFPDEAPEEAYQRLVQDFINPPGQGMVWNTREGSMVHAIFNAVALDSAKILDYGQFAVQLGFLKYSSGGYLDAKALEFGIERGEPTSAQVEVTFFGDVGTVIPAGHPVSTEGDDLTGDTGQAFLTNISDVIGLNGEVRIPATAEIPGSSGNVATGDITILVEPINGVAAVYNDVAAVGGVDSDDEEAFRAEALARAAAVPHSGNKDTYVIYALEDVEVSNVQVHDFWETSNGNDGNGTALLVLGGLVAPYISPAGVERLQAQIDPTVLPLAHFEVENWIGGSLIVNDPIEGQSSRSMSSGASLTTTMYLDKSIDLTRFDSDDDELRFFVKRISAGANISSLKLRLISETGNVVATISAATLNGIPDIATKGLAKVKRSDFVETGTFDWSAIERVQFELVATASGTAEVVLDGLRAVRVEGGFAAGLATLGIQVTVSSARAKIINVVAYVSLTGVQSVDDVYPEVEAELIALFQSKPPGETVRLSEVGNVLFDHLSINDYQGLTLNTVNANIALDPDQRPVLGSLTLGTFTS